MLSTQRLRRGRNSQFRHRSGHTQRRLGGWPVGRNERRGRVLAFSRRGAVPRFNPFGLATIIKAIGFLTLRMKEVSQ